MVVSDNFVPRFSEDGQRLYLGTAPPPEWGPQTTNVPRAFGGNMDNKELRPGTTLYLPVFNEGALFYAGDGHGVQGDGEVCVTAKTFSAIA